MTKKWRFILIGLIVVSSLMAFYLGWERHQVEEANKQVDLVLDWTQVKDLAGREGLTEEAVLKQFKGDISGVLFKESTLNDLVVSGAVLLRTGAELLWEMQAATGNGRLPVQNAQAAEIHSDWTYLIFQNPEDMARVESNLALKLNGAEPQVMSYYLQTTQGAIPVLGTSLKWKDLSNLGVGFEKDEFDLVHSLGLNIIPQIRYWRDVTEKDLKALLGQFEDLPLSAVFFNDNDLPGIGLPGARQSEALSNLAEQIDALGVPLGMVEFFPQKGLATVANFMEKNLVRMHSIPEKEMPVMSQSRALDRYTLAATDRDIRVLLVRFFPELGLKENGLYLTELRTSLEGEGFQLGKPEPFGALPVSRINLLVLGLGVAAGGMLLLDILKFRRLGLILGACGYLGFVGLLGLGEIGMARKAMALMAVLIFPILSVTVFLDEKPAGVGKAIWLLIKMTLVSLIGALLMVGLLADRSFMYTLDQFMGVKLAHLIPILSILIVFWFLKGYSRKSWNKVQKLLDYPVTVKYVILLGILAVVLLIYIMRTGNEGAAVSAWELALRARLDDILAVRPRTKEFLIGHPLMLLMLYLGYKDKYLPILAVAIIGQVSLVNTFAHIHTPVVISIMRTFNGLWLGILLGLTLIMVVKIAKKAVERFQLTIDKEE